MRVNPSLVKDYFRRIVQGFADISRSLHNLTRKGVTYWGAEQEVAFGAPKKALTPASILAYALAEGTIILDTDASSLNIWAVLSQEQGQV